MGQEWPRLRRPSPRLLAACPCQALLCWHPFALLSADKTEGPVTVLSFLGIEIDSVRMIFRLPVDKLEKLKGQVQGFCSVKKVTLRQMQSLLGLLVFACRIMPMGRVFSRRLSLATRGISRPEHKIRITRPLRADLAVWNEFLDTYNGHTCCQETEVSSLEVSLFTDAAGSVGFGAILGTEWCAEAWPPSWRKEGLCRNLTLLELFPIIVAVELWGSILQNRRVCFFSDNMGVVHCISRQSSSSPPVLALLRHLVLRCLQHNIWFRARHVPGVSNSTADALSRFRWQEFRELLPEAALEGRVCPPFLWDLVGNG